MFLLSLLIKAAITTDKLARKRWIGFSKIVFSAQGKTDIGRLAMPWQILGVFKCLHDLCVFFPSILLWKIVANLSNWALVNVKRTANFWKISASVFEELWDDALMRKCPGKFFSNCIAPFCCSLHLILSKKSLIFLFSCRLCVRLYAQTVPMLAKNKISCFTYSCVHSVL